MNRSFRFLVVLLTGLCAVRVQAGTTVALLDAPPSGITPQQREPLQNWLLVLEAELSCQADWQMVERARLAKIEQELALRLFGESEERRAILQGGWLGADLIVVPTVDGTKDPPSVSLRIISTRLGEQLENVRAGWPLPVVNTFCGNALTAALKRAREKLTRAAQQKTVAVLFFENQTQEGRLEYLGDKMSRDLAIRLSDGGTFHVLKRGEAVTARPETVLASTGWVEASDRWRAQHADVLVYGSYTMKPDPGVAAVELPIHVQYRVHFPAAGQSISNEFTLTTATWSEAVRKLADEISTEARSVKQAGTDVQATARAEAKRLLNEGKRLLAIKFDSAARRSGVPDEFLEDTPTQAARMFLLATFLAPDWEAPLRHLILLQPLGSDDKLSLGLEYLSRFGGVTSAEGQHMSCLLLTDVAGKLLLLGHGLPEVQRAEFCERHKLLLDIAEAGFLQVVSRVAEVAAQKGNLRANFPMNYYADYHVEEAMARDIAGPIGLLSTIKCPIGVWELLTQTAPQWRPVARPQAFRDYARTAATAAQKKEVRQQLKLWLENRKQSLSEREFAELREIYRLTSAGDELADQAEMQALRYGTTGVSTSLTTISQVALVASNQAETLTAADNTPHLAALRLVLSNAPPTEAFNIIENQISQQWKDAHALAYFPLYARVAMRSGHNINARAMAIQTIARWLDEQIQRSHRFCSSEFGLIQQTYETLGAPSWWIKLQQERLRLGKPPWVGWQGTLVSKNIGAQEVIHYPALRLPMPLISVSTREAVAAEDLPALRRGRSFYGLSVKVWSGMAPYRLMSLEGQLPSETSVGWLLDFDEQSQWWRNLSDAAGLQHAPITVVRTFGQQVFAGTLGSGLCVFDLRAGNGRILTLEDGLPSLHVTDLVVSGNQLWMSGGEELPVLARIDLSSMKVFIVPLHEPRRSNSTLTIWQNRLWFGSLRRLREVEPRTNRLVTRQPSTPIPVAQLRTQLCALDDAGLFAVDQNLAVTPLGRAVQDFYRNDQKRFCQFCSIVHDGRPVIGSSDGGNYFQFQSQFRNWRDQVEFNIAELQHLRAGQGTARWKNFGLERKEDRLIPRTRVPPLSDLVHDGEWVWALSGKKVFLFRTATQTWHGCIDLPQAATSIAVMSNAVWMGGDKLLVMDRDAALRHATATGLSNQLADTDIEEAVARLPLGDQGIFHFALGKFERATACLEKAVADDITEPEYFTTLFFIHSPWGLHQPDKWKQYGDQILQLYPDTTWSRTVQDWRTYAASRSKDSP